MANIGLKHGIYHVRFRFGGKEYKKSLKTGEKSAAEAAKASVELTIHRLLTGLLQLSPDVDPGDFILSGGTRTQPVNPAPKVIVPSIIKLRDDYLVSQKDLMAKSYHDSHALHLRHLIRYLDGKAEEPTDQVTFRDLDAYIKSRLAKRHPNTAERERITLKLFFKWIVAQGYLETSPAAGLAPIKGGQDRPPFRTIAEINRIIERGGLSGEEIFDVWECLYLMPEEIAQLLATVRSNAKEDVSYMLHAIPAYTGMRRGEVLRLRWLDVDLTEDYLYARSRKQSRRRSETVRRIDLHPELKQELVAWRTAHPKGQFVICQGKSLDELPKDKANRYFWSPMEGTDWCLHKKRHLFKVGFHTYRHSFASNLAARGVDQRVVDEFMGHQTEAMRKRYRHLFPKDRRSAIECFSLATANGAEQCSRTA